jgi:hypothetical protein
MSTSEELLGTQVVEGPSITASVFLHGIIRRPILNVPMSREEVIAELRAALSHRITWGTWGPGLEHDPYGEEEYEGGDSDE